MQLIHTTATIRADRFAKGSPRETPQGWDDVLQKKVFPLLADKNAN